ncbi:hypothetical protein LIER_37313 [Lithospermum erythrorhizon]|uniref:Uncharacterized protein n=1 Tax=Lithospermum erythrorhizon TaxID=34254 RepID=A0AAV3PL03_LITER
MVSSCRTVPVYIGNTVLRFPLTREEMWTLQENQMVSSLVIDNWSNLLNLKQTDGPWTRLFLTCESALHTLFKITRTNYADNRSTEFAAKDFI